MIVFRNVHNLLTHYVPYGRTVENKLGEHIRIFIRMHLASFLSSIRTILIENSPGEENMKRKESFLINQWYLLLHNKALLICKLLGNVEDMEAPEHNLHGRY